PDKRWLAISLPDGSMRFRRIADAGLVRDKIPLPPHTLKGAAHLVSSADGRWLVAHPPGSVTATLWSLERNLPSLRCMLAVGNTSISKIVAKDDGTLIAAQTVRVDVGKAVDTKASILLWRSSRIKDGAVSEGAEISGELLSTRFTNGALLLRK